MQTRLQSSIAAQIKGGCQLKTTIHEVKNTIKWRIFYKLGWVWWKVGLRLQWQTGFDFSQSWEMCRNSSTAAQTTFPSLSMLQRLESTRFSPGMPIFFFFQQKQEAQSNLCLTQWLSLGSRGRTLWFAHLSLSFSHRQKHTEAQCCSTTHIRAFSTTIYLH